MADSEQRRKRLAAEGGTAKTLRDSEDRFLREEKLKDDLDFAIRQKLELESALLERDARAIEQRFEIEASELEIDRLKRRVKELEAAYRGINAVVSSGPVTVNSAKGKANSSAFDIGIPGIPAVNVVPGGGNTKRERELEGVVEAMKRVIDKLKTENDRYKKTGGTEEKRLQEFERRWQNEKKRADKLEEESKSAASKLKLQDESSQRIIQKQQQVASLRKQLKAKDDELASIRENYEANDLDRGALKAKVNSLEDKVQQLQISLEQARVAAKQAAAIGSSNNSANVRGGAAGGTMTAEQKRELDNLRSKFEEQNEELKMLRSQLRDRLESSGYHRQMEEDFVTKAEYKRIRDENERLKQELSAFDLDFFEEIENLKFAHAEAMRKLRMYEDRAGGTARR